MKVNTEQDCTFMAGWTQEQIKGSVGVALAELGEQVNVIISGLSRVPEVERGRIGDNILAEMGSQLGRIQGAFAAAS